MSLNPAEIHRLRASSQSVAHMLENPSQGFDITRWHDWQYLVSDPKLILSLLTDLDKARADAANWKSQLDAKQDESKGFLPKINQEKAEAAKEEEAIKMPPAQGFFLDGRELFQMLRERAAQQESKGINVEDLIGVVTDAFNGTPGKTEKEAVEDALDTLARSLPVFLSIFRSARG